ncbi:MAG TPA: undecaprenyl/decaprenyl-phosphate alpha-N-acetylglucosaminyl 1-phosphate transferase [Chloroflexi bacterium]|nr:undecaprenyl/decaprenyl-phosphate alpha-N-acetylglucosaminyl 1-phosphate transferase [Chloroflexota bacterium]
MTVLYLAVFAVPLLLAFFLTPLVERLARRWGFVDYPREPRHLHEAPTPKLGGVALFVPFLIAVGLSLILYPPSVQPEPDLSEPLRLAGLIIGSLIVFLVGVYDDKRELSPWPQLAVQFVAAGVAIYSGIVIHEIASPFGGLVTFPPWFAIAFTLFWIMGMMNTINWLDGLDGLAAGITVIASLIFFAHSNRLGQVSIALLPLALAGCTLGFLPYNFYPARLFMGTSGALFLGFALGTLSIIGGAKAATALLVLGIPILDVAWQIVNRLRQRRSPLRGDRGHLHHRLLDMGISRRRVVLLFYLLCASFGGLALLLPPGLYKLYALLVLGVVAATVLFLASREV